MNAVLSPVRPQQSKLDAEKPSKANDREFMPGFIDDEDEDRSTKKRNSSKQISPAAKGNFDNFSITSFQQMNSNRSSYRQPVSDQDLDF